MRIGCLFLSGLCGIMLAEEARGDFLVDSDGGTYSATVFRYSDDGGALLGRIGPNSTLGVPEGITYGPDGKVYIGAAFGTNKVLTYGSGGQNQQIFVGEGQGGLFGPRDITFGPDGNLYVASYYSGGVMRYNGTTGANLPAPLQSGAVFASITNPVGLAFGPDGNLYVTSANRSVTQIAISGGNPASQSYVVGPSSPLLPSSGIGGLTFSPDGRWLYVHDGTQVARFDSLSSWAGSTVIASGLGGGEGIRFGTDGNLYVAATSPNGVFKYSPTGSYLGRFVPTWIATPPPDGTLNPEGLGAATWFAFSPVPEPPTLALLIGAGLTLAIAALRRGALGKSIAGADETCASTTGSKS